MASREFCRKEKTSTFEPWAGVRVDTTFNYTRFQQNGKGSIIGGLKNHVFNTALSYSPQRLPGVGGKPGMLRIHKAQGPCGGLAENKKGSVCFAKYFVRFVVKKIRFFKCEIASLAYTHSQ